MSRPTPLDDERFVAPPPLGYKSEQGRSIHIGLMIAFAVVTIVGPIGFQVYEQFRMQGQMQQGFTLARSYLPAMSAKWGDKFVVATKDQYVGGVGGASERGSLVAFSLKDGAPVKLPMEANGGIANPLADVPPLALVANDETAYLMTYDTLYSVTAKDGGIKSSREMTFDLESGGFEADLQRIIAFVGKSPATVHVLSKVFSNLEVPIFEVSSLDELSTKKSFIFMGPWRKENGSSEEILEFSKHIERSLEITSYAAASDKPTLVAVGTKEGIFFQKIEVEQLPESVEDRILPGDKDVLDRIKAIQSKWEVVSSDPDLIVGAVLESDGITRIIARGKDPFTYLIFERTATGWNPEPRLITRADLGVPDDGGISVIAGEDDQTYVFISNDVSHGLRMHKVVAGQLQPPIVLAGWMAQPAVAWYMAVIGQNMIFGFAILFLIGIVPTVLMALFRTSHVELADSTVEMASILRRGIAKMIDMFLIFTPPYAIAGWFLYRADWPAIIAEFQDPNFAQQGLSAWLIRGLFWGLAACIYAMTTFLLYCWMEGTWGKTPGKLICGIETLRTTLRPCGFFRSILRNAAIMIDGFFNYVVGVMLIALQYKWQRVGDLLADTVVVRTRRPQVDADGTVV